MLLVHVKRWLAAVGRREAWHISTSAFLKEENRKSRLVARVLSKLGPPFTSGVIGGGCSASATAILRFVSPQRPQHVRKLGDVGTGANISPRCVVEWYRPSNPDFPACSAFFLSRNLVLVLIRFQFFPRARYSFLRFDSHAFRTKRIFHELFHRRVHVSPKLLSLVNFILAHRILSPFPF